MFYGNVRGFSAGNAGAVFLREREIGFSVENAGAVFLRERERLLAWRRRGMCFSGT
ncbi:hypothetical protein [Bartonella grahamii]|uniref:hypothetical protein n=1 Tax=Bartonella grahamii TaxID=33045 RepID=UPI002E7C19CE|nr:hypothetical protein [Bartonella grahamii]